MLIGSGITLYQPSRGGGDPYQANVVLLCGFEGTDGSTSFVDESSFARALTAGGAAQIDTAQFKFGASSLLLDGAGSYVQAADSADWNFGAGQFTIEAFMRKSTTGSEWTVASQWSNVSQPTNAAWAFWGTTGGCYLYFFDSGGALRTVGASCDNTPNVWRHRAVDRDATGKIRVYEDGVMIASATLAQTMIDSPQPVRIGSLQGFGNDLNGWLDEVRITKGVARYASDGGFTVPTAAFPRS